MSSMCDRIWASPALRDLRRLDVVRKELISVPCMNYYHAICFYFIFSFWSVLSL